VFSQRRPQFAHGSIEGAGRGLDRAREEESDKIGARQFDGPGQCDAVPIVDIGPVLEEQTHDLDRPVLDGDPKAC
jgi:hypothetical protein